MPILRWRPRWDQQQRLLRKRRKAQPVMIYKNDIEIDKATKKSRKQFAERISTNVPKSEVWFIKLYKAHQDINDFYNKPLGNYIPDISNYRFKYVIEIDGSIHELEAVKIRDKIKDQYYQEHGYRVIRVRAYNQDDFDKMMFILRILRGQLIKRSYITFETQEQIDFHMKYHK